MSFVDSVACFRNLKISFPTSRVSFLPTEFSFLPLKIFLINAYRSFKRLKIHIYTLKKSSVNKNRTFGGKIRGKIGFLGGGERNLPGHKANLNHNPKNPF
jgi:hypothetical protein